MTIFISLLAAGRLPGQEGRLQALVSIEDERYGAKPDDPSFDNGPIIQKALEESKGIIYVPPRTYYVKSTIVTPNASGRSLQGVGAAYHRKAGAFSEPGVSRIVWNGEAGGDLMHYRGNGMSLDQITLVGHEWWNNESREQSYKNRAGCLIRVIRATRTGPVPAGAMNVGSLSLCNADVGIWCDPSGGENHTDHLTYQFLRSQDVATVYRSTNKQSCHHTIQHMSAGNAEILFDFQTGGHLSVFDLAFASPVTVLRTNDLTINKCNFVIQNMKVDARAAGWRLLEMQKEVPLRLRVGGIVANIATPIDDVVLGDPDIRTDIFNFENYPKEAVGR